MNPKLRSEIRVVIKAEIRAAKFGGPRMKKVFTRWKRYSNLVNGGRRGSKQHIRFILRGLKEDDRTLQEIDPNATAILVQHSRQVQRAYEEVLRWGPETKMGQREAVFAARKLTKLVRAMRVMRPGL